MFLCSTSEDCITWQTNSLIKSEHFYYENSVSWEWQYYALRVLFGSLPSSRLGLPAVYVCIHPMRCCTSTLYTSDEMLHLDNTLHFTSSPWCCHYTKLRPVLLTRGLTDGHPCRQLVSRQSPGHLMTCTTHELHHDHNFWDSCDLCYNGRIYCLYTGCATTRYILLNFGTVFSHLNGYRLLIFVI